MSAKKRQQPPLPERPATARLDGDEPVGILHSPDGYLAVAIRLDHGPDRPAHLLVTEDEALSLAEQLIRTVRAQRDEEVPE